MHTRRAFLRTVGTGAALSVLAACGAGNPLNRFRPTPTPEIRDLNLLVAGEYMFLYDFANLADPWNEENPHWPLNILEAGFDELALRVAEDTAAGQSSFDGALAASLPLESGIWFGQDLLQPWEPFLSESPRPGAEDMTEWLSAPVREAVSSQGQLMGLPISVSSISLAWLKSRLAEAGIADAPVSWDDIWLAAQAIRDATNLTPFDRLFSPTGDLLALMWGAISDPVTPEGPLAWESDEVIMALQWLQDLVSAELMPERERGFNSWMAGRTGIILGVDVHSSLTQFQLGPDAAAVGRNARLHRDDPKAGTPFWVQCLVITKGSLNPQATADFGLWWLGPENMAFQKRIADFGPKPAYSFVFEDPIMSDSRYDWQRQAMDDIAASVPLPKHGVFAQELEIASGWMAQALDPDLGLSARDALRNVMAESRQLHASTL